jgi:hypothetical protein
MTMTPRSRLYESEITKRYLRRQAIKKFLFAVGGTFLAWYAMVTFTAPAHARGIHRNHAIHHHVALRAPTGVITCNRFGCHGEATAIMHIYKRTKHEARAERIPLARFDANGNSDGIIGGRPAGCPHAYCGCGLARYLGLNDPRLNLAWNWARLFPRTRAHPGAAAVRAHHVMLLVAHVEGSVWTVRDYNGGRHLSYIHERDTRGYVFVEPSGGRFAANWNL